MSKTQEMSLPRNTIERSNEVEDDVQIQTKFNGIIQLVDQHRMIASRGFELFESLDSGQSWSSLGTAPVGLKYRLRGWPGMLRRFCRAAIGHVINLNEDSLLVFAADKVWRYNLAKRRFESSSPVVGSRPLAICKLDEQTLFYGEYRRNLERTATHLWRTQDGGRSWTPVHRFTNVRHLHGVFHDPFTNSLWVTTGDDDSESWLWQSFDGGETMQRVIGGNQQYRAVHLIFRKDAIYFGSDTPREQNHLYRLNRNDQSVDQVCKVDNSVFFATEVDNTMCFSTACEPSDVNRSPTASIWASSNGEEWSPIISMKKDRWPSRWLQHGHIRFPTGASQSRRLYFTAMATNLHEKVLSLDLNSKQSHETATDTKAA